MTSHFQKKTLFRTHKNEGKKKIWTERHLLAAIALGCGLIAAFLTNQLLAEKMEEIKTTHQSSVKRSLKVQEDTNPKLDPIAVIVASTTILPGTRLGKHNLGERLVPRDFVPSYALSAASFAQLDNQSSAYRIQAGDMLSTSLLRSSSSLSADISPNKKVPSLLNEEQNRREITILYGIENNKELLNTTLAEAKSGSENQDSLLMRSH